jgi:hypothetical protein
LQVELSDFISVGALLFAGGGAWVVLRQTAKRGADQGRRIGKIEIELAEMRGIRIGRTAAKGIPIQSVPTAIEEGEDT